MAETPLIIILPNKTAKYYRQNCLQFLSVVKATALKQQIIIVLSTRKHRS